MCEREVPEQQKTPGELIRKAIVMVVAEPVNVQLKSYKHHGIHIEDEIDILRDSTDGKCMIASKRVIEHLLNQYYQDDDFPKLDIYFLLKGIRSPAMPFKRLPHDFSWHVYGVVKILGKWYAFSPGNYGMSGADPLTTVVSVDSLDELISTLRHVEGGIWPSADVVEEFIGQETYYSESGIDMVSGDRYRGKVEVVRWNSQLTENSEKIGRSRTASAVKRVINHLKRG